MKRIFIFAISILLFVAVSCSRKNDKGVESDSEIITMTGESVWNDSFISISEMVLSDTILWINSEQDNNTIMYAYNLNGDFIAKGIAYGKGPGEIRCKSIRESGWRM